MVMFESPVYPLHVCLSGIVSTPSWILSAATLALTSHSSTDSSAPCASSSKTWICAPYVLGKVKSTLPPKLVLYFWYTVEPPLNGPPSTTDACDKTDSLKVLNVYISPWTLSLENLLNCRHLTMKDSTAWPVLA